MFPEERTRTEKVQIGSGEWQVIPAVNLVACRCWCGYRATSSHGIDEVARFDSMNLRWESRAYRSPRDRYISDDKGVCNGKKKVSARRMMIGLLSSSFIYLYNDRYSHTTKWICTYGKSRGHFLALCHNPNYSFSCFFCIPAVTILPDIS